MALPYADDEPELTSDEKKAKVIVNLHKVMAVAVIVSIVVYFSLVLGLDWNPLIAIIPVLAVLITVWYYFYSRLQKINAESENHPQRIPSPQPREGSTGRALVFKESEKKVTGDGIFKAVTTLLLVVTAVIIVSFIEIYYIISGLYWDPVIATIPVLMVLIPFGYYLDRKVQAIDDGKKKSETLRMILASLIFCFLAATVIDIFDGKYSSNKFTFILKMGLIILTIVLMIIYSHARDRDTVQPSEESYNALLKHAIGIIIADVIIIFGCFILGTMYGGLTGPLLFVVLAVCFISLWCLALKMRSLGFMS